MSYLPEDDKKRKMIPLFAYLTRYFPKAHREVAKVCVVNNVRYNPDRSPADINWARGKSPDQLGSAFRHMMEATIDGKVFEDVPPDVAKVTGIDRVYVLAEAMWRIGAQLELEIEKQEAKKEGVLLPAITDLPSPPVPVGTTTLPPSFLPTCLSPGSPAPVRGCDCPVCATVRGNAATST